MSSSWLVTWCFQPSQPQRITSGLNTNFNLSPSHSLHKSSYHKSCFWAYLYSAGTQHRNLPLAGWPFLFCGPTQEPCFSHSQHRKNWEKFWKKMQMNGPEREKEARKKSLVVSIACIAIYRPTPGFKGRTFKLCVLTRWDFNFCVRSSPLHRSSSWGFKAKMPVGLNVKNVPVFLLAGSVLLLMLSTLLALSTLLTYLRLTHLLANSAPLLTLVHCAFLQHTLKAMADMPFHTLHPLTGTTFLKLFETQNLHFL